MFNKKIILAMLAIVLAFGMTLIACGDDPSDGGGPGPGGTDPVETPINITESSEDRVSFVDGEYELIIGKNTASASVNRAYNPGNGDVYVLLKLAEIISKGTISVTATTNFTFTPTAAYGGVSNKFTATLTSGELTITSDIKDKDGKKIPFKEKPNWGPAGTWKTGSFTLVVTGTYTGGSWSWSNGPQTFTGSYTAVGNTFAYSGSGGVSGTAYLIDYRSLSVSGQGGGSGTYIRQ